MLVAEGQRLLTPQKPIHCQLMSACPRSEETQQEKKKKTGAEMLYQLPQCESQELHFLPPIILRLIFRRPPLTTSHSY